MPVSADGHPFLAVSPSPQGVTYIFVGTGARHPTTSTSSPSPTSRPPPAVEHANPSARTGASEPTHQRCTSQSPDTTAFWLQSLRVQRAIMISTISLLLGLPLVYWAFRTASGLHKNIKDARQSGLPFIVARKQFHPWPINYMTS